MNTNKKHVWIRLAGNAKSIKARGKYGWRCFISETPIQVPLADTEISLVHWNVLGKSDKKNFVPGTYNFSADKSENPTLVAWIDMFGNITIENEVACIELLPLET